MRALRGHPWAFLGEVEFVGEPPVDGDCVELTDLKGRCLGAGLWNGKSQIAWRRYSRRPITLDGPLLEELVTASVNRRAGKPVCRLIWSEADSLPGLVVDRYNDLITIQALTCGIDRRLATIIDVLQRLLKPREIVLRNDAATRKLEGLRQEIRTVSGKPLEPAWMEVGGVQVLIDLMGGQKTGTYLDQLDQHQHVAKLAQGRRVLDAFCNQGGFGLACAKAGATSVLGLDQSEDAITAARSAAERNGLSASFEVANVFDWFTEHPPQAKSADPMRHALLLKRGWGAPDGEWLGPAKGGQGKRQETRNKGGQATVHGGLAASPDDCILKSPVS